MPPVRITEVRDVRQNAQVFAATIELDNGDDYSLRLSTDSIGNVYVWVDHRPKRGKWTKVAEIHNGKQRSI